MRLLPICWMKLLVGCSSVLDPPRVILPALSPFSVSVDLKRESWISECCQSLVKWCAPLLCTALCSTILKKDTTGDLLIDLCIFMLFVF